MATPRKRPAGDKRAPAYPSRQPSRWLRNLALLALLLAAAALAWSWKGLSEQALVGSAFGARVGCECRFISRRPLKSCEGDLKRAGLGRLGGLVALSEDTATKTVKASVPLLARQSASFDEQTGCRLEPWED
ncbi:hypothetical protein SAMN05518801_103195 [Novosphingobium sp. CF614]|uniref:hypothetical protein n=1 Tax=Novosphingobium sp. CF614 TaxID=1884364 RepID=UPI0008E14F7C|nr:hypothetical protein [Novosphingobium sp. CF614]SFF92086.1 hypothetical protein SAMN05518801_103195 [Novosphingobium sp. CF614]